MSPLSVLPQTGHPVKVIAGHECKEIVSASRLFFSAGLLLNEAFVIQME